MSGNRIREASDELRRAVEYASSAEADMGRDELAEARRKVANARAHLKAAARLIDAEAGDR